MPQAASTAVLATAVRPRLTLLKTGSGTLILSGSNSYTGGTNVEAGILQVTNAEALPAGASLIVGARLPTLRCLAASRSRGRRLTSGARTWNADVARRGGLRCGRLPMCAVATEDVPLTVEVNAGRT